MATGSDDFMVEVAAQDLADYERVLLDQILAIPAVTQARTHLRHPHRAEPRPGAPDSLALTLLALTHWFRRVPEGSPTDAHGPKALIERTFGS